jgi:glc operon protein GlcG
MNLAHTLGATLLLVAASAAASRGQVAAKKSLTLDGAKKVIAAAREFAAKNQAPGAAIAVVDDGGNLIAVERLDNTFAAGALISVGKARTAAIFKRPTSAFEKIIREGRTPMVALNDFTPLMGGVPITVDGQTVGAVGVSGAASAQQDEEIANAAAGSISGAGVSPVSFFPADAVRESFAAGIPLLEVPGYKVHTSRREKPGLAEIHTDETDVIYVVEGTATFVTGGSAVDAKITGPGQLRGSSITGGETRKLKKGDIIIVPPNTPHQFTEVSNPFLYFTVKPIGAN